MLIVDCHVHSGWEKPEKIVAEMDKHGIDKLVLFSPYPGETTNEYSDAFLFNSKRQREVASYVAEVQREYPDRIIGFIWLEPRLEDAVEILEWAIADLELKGVKMIPYHWYPYEKNLLKVYEKVEELGVPIIFHSGILFGFENSSRYCRPVNYEVLVKYPKLRFALAHVGWPWVDECIALWGRFRHAARGGKVQMYIDATPGTPRIYRRETFQKLLAYGAGDYMLFGSDSRASSLGYSKEVVKMDIDILEKELGASRNQVEKYMGLNALEFLGIK